MPNEPLRPSWFRSRFGRRLIFLFVVCSLLPTIALALLSYGTVTRQLTHASYDRLEHTAGLLGRGILNRVESLDDDLKSTPARSEPCPLTGAGAETAACNGSLEYGFSALAFVPKGRAPVPLFGTVGPVPTLGASEREALARGLAVVTGRIVDGRPAVYLLRLTHVAANEGLFAAEVYQPYLWGDFDQSQLLPSMGSYVADQSGAVIAASRPGDETLPAGARAEIAEAGTGVGTFEWTPKGEPSLAGYRTMPASDSLLIPRWTLIVSESRAAVVAPLADFRRTFPVVALVSLGVAVALSLFQLRRSLAPLNALHAGTRRLAERRFDHRVTVTSRDEFADVAASFNAMADEIRHQFSALQAAAEIDRALLAAGTVPAIIRTTLDHMGPASGGADRVAITLITPAGDGGATTYLKDDATGTVTIAWVGLNTHSVADHLGAGGTALALRAADAPAYLAPLAALGAKSLLVLPLVYQNRLLGAITLSDARPADRTEDGLDQARHAAGQVALALANAHMVERIRMLAFYDSLTGLPNRLSFRNRLTEELERHRTEEGTMLAVFFLDLDHFSRINDTLGHKFGDRLVQEVGRRIKACCAKGAPAAEVARLGGDEFTIILPRLYAPAEAASLAQSILESFGTPFALDDHEVFVSASIGVSMNLGDDTDLESMVKNADAAMYQAKQKGRNRFELYAPAMGKSAAKRLSLENQIRKAIDAKQFVLWYQPIIDLASGAIASGEALIRWQHPEWGMVGPGEFIGLAEESGLIVPLGEWILETVCAQNLMWQRQGLHAIPIAVNVSGQQLRGDTIVSAVRRALGTSGLDPRYLELELTESILMQGEGEASATLHTLAGLGIQLTIDDFGIGYSSLSYLKQFPVSALKIDQSFVRDVTTNSNDAAIASAIIAMASALDLTVVAEGVETDEQVRFLRHQGCARIQGYLVGRPVAAHTFAAYLRPDSLIILPPVSAQSQHSHRTPRLVGERRPALKS